MRLGGCVVRVLSAGEVLNEYMPDTDAERGVATCWIESLEGQPFTVHVRLASPLRAIALRLLADGVVLDEAISHGSAGASGKVQFDGVRAGSGVRPFVFGQGVRATEDYDPEEMPLDADAQGWKQRGVITLEMCSVNITSFGPAEDEPYDEGARARLQTVRVGDAFHMDDEDDMTLTCEPENGDEFVPFATFHFKHRTKEWLQSYGIMPRPFELDLSAWSVSAEGPPLVHEMREMTVRDTEMG